MSRLSVASNRAAKVPVRDPNYIEPHFGPDKYPRLRSDFVKIRVTSTGCWEWIGDPAEDHYVRLYELLFDPLDKGMVLEPICKTVGCVCPFHLKVVQERGHDWKKLDLIDEDDVPDLPIAKRERLKKVVLTIVPSPILVDAEDKAPRSYAIPTKKEREALKAKQASKAAEDLKMVSVATGVKSCQNGHPQTPDNQYVYPNGTRKECLTCKRLRGAKRK